MKEVRTLIENGILFINIPKFIYDGSTKTELPIGGKVILSNVKIARDKIIIEMDSAGLLIEDFEITTNKNILTIEIMKGISGVPDQYKTKVDLPEDCNIDDITKIITSVGKLLVTIPRKVQEFIVDPSSHSSRMDLDESSKFILAEKRRSCLVLSKTNDGAKSKFVKFLVDDSKRFATLPRTKTIALTKSTILLIKISN
ncbi:hypothetical protein HHI36_004016 [Cryptolaemus montrouzieri]|uniref:SHSP domain-containing protein n=1 Tax=Cryptolaemus montrouzieri TaxID=559131 RepID=A0ABD2NQ83_9CUCU